MSKVTMNWILALARVIGAGIPFGGMVVQMSAEWDARKVQQRLYKLEDPVSALHPDVREFSKLLYAQVTASDESRIQLSDGELDRYTRVIAILESSGFLQGTHALGRRHPIALWVTNPTYLLYMAALFENPDAMAKLTYHVDSCAAGQWLKGAEVASECGVPLPVVRAIFELYESRGLGLLSKESGTTNYLCKA
jgi:hypothetical protein